MPTITHETTIHSVPAPIIEALTTEKGLASFWTDQVRAEPKVGSEAWFGFGPNAETQFTFDVAAIDKDRVEWRCVAGPDEWIGTTVRWTLGPGHDGGTQLKFQHADRNIVFQICWRRVANGTKRSL